MTKFESDVKHIQAPQERIFATLADLNNLGRIADRLPSDKIKDFSFDGDSCSLSVDPVGALTFRIIEREPCKTIKIEAEKSPMPLFLWIQLIGVSPNETKMKLTIKAEMNIFIKGMVSKPLQEGLNKIADLLASINY